MTMKIALLLSVPLISASVFAAATTQSSNTFGLLRVDSTQKQTFVCVPWVAASATGDSPIPITDIIKTANLTPSGNGYEGDELHWYDPSKKSYKSWHLVPGESGAAPVWEATTTISEKGGESGAPAAGTALSRGDAFVLVRQNPTDDNGAAIPFYLLGQVASTSGNVVNTLPQGAYSLLAPPIATSADSFDLNDDTKVTWGTSEGNKPNANDVIIVPDSGVTLNWNAATGKWGTGDRAWDSEQGQIVFQWDENPNTKVKSGCGAWYVNGGVSDVKVYWK